MSSSPPLSPKERLIHDLRRQISQMNARYEESQSRITTLEERLGSQAPGVVQVTTLPLITTHPVSPHQNASQTSNNDLGTSERGREERPDTPYLSQHGIRAQARWMTQQVVARDTGKTPFKLESPAEYSTWKYAMTKYMERENLMPFVNGEAITPSMLDFGDP